MSVRRAVALATLLCAIGAGALALPWFRAAVSGRDVTLSGPEVGPVTWSIAPAAILIVGLVVSAARRGNLTAPSAWWSLMTAAAAAMFACAAALLTVWFPGAGVRAEGVAGAPLVPLDRLPAGLVAAGAFAGVAALVCSWMIGIANVVESGDRGA